ncbi:hypothetical protein DFH09DRAFT_1105572 [Mycena vulgaris]|nr:hypothetical protein DFH09DRAFT_1105572 [Mycena vulgaris]
MQPYQSFAFTDALLPLMKTTAKRDSAGVRIVNVSSNAHSLVNPTAFATKEAFNKDCGTSFRSTVDTEGVTKLANILDVKGLQTRLNMAAVPITRLSLHSGAIKNEDSDGFLGTLPIVGRFIKTHLMPLVLGTWDMDAMNVAFAAAGKEVAAQRTLDQGAYLVPPATVFSPSSLGLCAIPGTPSRRFDGFRRRVADSFRRALRLRF